MTHAKVWVLDRRVFQQVMMLSGLKRMEDNIKFLSSVPLLQNLHKDHLTKIADALEVVSVRNDQGFLFTPWMFPICSLAFSVPESLFESKSYIASKRITEIRLQMAWKW